MVSNEGVKLFDILWVDQLERVMVLNEGAQLFEILTIDLEDIGFKLFDILRVIR